MLGLPLLDELFCKEDTRLMVPIPKLDCALKTGSGRRSGFLWRTLRRGSACAAAQHGARRRRQGHEITTIQSPLLPHLVLLCY